ncbi:MAG: RHS repeat-associated core domain-containing protein, partial [Thermoanaerobaculum sp.]
WPFGEEMTSPASQERMRFAGHERDASTGYDYMHARYYASVAGRFLSVDPGRDYDPKNPQSFNLYAYVRNNPVSAVDPDGRAINPVLLGAASGFVASLVGETYARVVFDKKPLRQALREGFKESWRGAATGASAGLHPLAGLAVAAGLEYFIPTDPRASSKEKADKAGEAAVGAGLGWASGGILEAKALLQGSQGRFTAVGVAVGSELFPLAMDIGVRLFGEAKAPKASDEQLKDKREQQRQLEEEQKHLVMTYPENSEGK